MKSINFRATVTNHPVEIFTDLSFLYIFPEEIWIFLKWERKRLIINECRKITYTRLTHAARGGEVSSRKEYICDDIRDSDYFCDWPEPTKARRAVLQPDWTRIGREIGPPSVVGVAGVARGSSRWSINFVVWRGISDSPNWLSCLLTQPCLQRAVALDWSARVNMFSA